MWERLMDGRLAALDLNEAERGELTALASRRRTAQALALRARSVLGCAAASGTRRSRAVSASIRRR
jgi:hypothetical protein